MSKRGNHTKCRKITFAALKRKYSLLEKLQNGAIKESEYIKLISMPLKRYLELGKKQP